MRVRSMLVVGLILWPALAGGQTANQPGGPEVMGTISISRLWDDESGLGTGVEGGTGVGYVWRRRLGLEALIEGFRHERNFSSGVRFEAHGSRVLGKVTYYWSDRNVQPFAAGIAGVMQVTRRSEYPVERPGPGGMPLVIGTEVFENEYTDLVWGGSGGLRIRVRERFALRPEGGLLVSAPDNFIEIRFGVTAIVRW
ncbi:MAG TPA: hypothetical protein VFO19_23630 [Vicinamibacterales bacterium]|nr:hypothetical protein [Vicinamibacterales bacterium]